MKMLVKIKQILIEEKTISFWLFLKVALVGFITGFLICLIWTL